MFTTYLQLGFEHILDVAGYDHILFILTITVLYLKLPLKSLILIVTAFTIGHSITLALSSFGILNIPSHWVELSIPITIILACLENLFFLHNKRSIFFRYTITLLFGFIHGMGFSNFFKALLGKEESILLPLFSFNVGVELAQLCILLLGTFLLAIISKWIKKTDIIVYSVSFTILLISFRILFEKLSEF